MWSFTDSIPEGTTFNTWKIGVGNSRQNVQCAKDIKAEEFVRRFKEIIMR